MKRDDNEEDYKRLQDEGEATYSHPAFDQKTFNVDVISAKARIRQIKQDKEALELQKRSLKIEEKLEKSQTLLAWALFYVGFMGLIIGAMAIYANL